MKVYVYISLSSNLWRRVSLFYYQVPHGGTCFYFILQYPIKVRHSQVPHEVLSLYNYLVTMDIPVSTSL